MVEDEVDTTVLIVAINTVSLQEAKSELATIVDTFRHGTGAIKILVTRSFSRYLLPDTSLLIINRFGLSGWVHL